MSSNAKKTILKEIKKNRDHLKNSLGMLPALPKIPKKFLSSGNSGKGELEKFSKQLEAAHGVVEVLSRKNTLENIKKKFNIMDDKSINLSTTIKNKLKTELKNKAKPKITGKDFLADQRKEQATLKWAFIDGEMGVEENGAIWVDLNKLSKVTHSSLPFLIENLVIVLDKKNLVKSMHHAYSQINQIQLKQKKQSFSNGVFIAGPSKTGDIEHNLVIGAHGAKKLIVVIK